MVLFLGLVVFSIWFLFIGDTNVTVGSTERPGGGGTGGGGSGGGGRTGEDNFYPVRI